MSAYRLRAEVRDHVQFLAEVMLRLNAGPHDRNHYKAMYDAISAIVALEVGQPVADHICHKLRDGFNWGGNHSYAEDVEVAIEVAITELKFGE